MDPTLATNVTQTATGAPPMTDPNVIQTLIHMFQEGGIWMAPIGICLAVSVAIVIERFLRLFMQFNIDGSSFMFEIQKYILANDIDGAIRVCNGSDKALVPRVVKAGLQRSSRDESQIQNAVDAASLEVIPKVEKRIPYLAMIANVATLFGLLGTISGLIRSFAAVSMADPAQRQAILAAGISEAMNATAFGLVTAIFSMVMHSILTARATKILEEVDEFSVKLIDILSARKYRHASERVE